MKRYGYCSINISLEDAWNRTLVFFENHRGKIKDQYISTNNLYRKLETYEMTFGYNPSDDTTYISVSAKYSHFGKGIPSKVPKDMIKKWAYEMGITPMKLVKEIDYNFLANLDKIQEIPLHQIANLSKLFCAACGEANSIKSTICVSCGTQLDR
ncbi:MAG: hypothetical protein ACTSR5_14880 [Promethearchaeota archaeon]